MKKILPSLIFLIQLVAQAQPKTKKVLLEGSGPPVVLLHGGTFDYNAYAAHENF